MGFSRKTRLILIVIVMIAAWASTRSETMGAAVSMPLDSRKAKADPEKHLLWYDARDLGVVGKGWTDTEFFYDRLPAKAGAAVQAAQPAVWDGRRDTAGMGIRFNTDAADIQVRWTLTRSRLTDGTIPIPGCSGVDLYVHDNDGQWHFLKNGVPFGPSNQVSIPGVNGRPCLLYLPLYNGVTSVEIGISPNASLSKPENDLFKKSKPIVIYGTSITQGYAASRPGMAYTSIIGRQLNLPVINLGFAGNGNMSPVMADLMGELDPAIYVLDCLWNMTPEMMTERVEPFVKKLRAARPHTPILLVEDCSYSNTSPTSKGVILRSIFAKLKEQGIMDLYFLAGKGMLGEDADGTLDCCHPNDLGMYRQACVFVQALAPILNINAAQAAGTSKPEENKSCSPFSNGAVTLFKVCNKDAYVITPAREVDRERRLVMIAPAWLGISHDDNNVEYRYYVETLLAHGFHVAGVETGITCGSPAGVEVYQQFYEQVTRQYRLNPRARIIAQSNGGLISLAWTFRHPDLVDRIFGVCPVTDFRTWPKLVNVCDPKFTGPGVGYGLTVKELEARIGEFNPIDNLKPLASAGIKVFLLHGDKDTLVPMGPNSEEFVKRYRAYGGDASLEVAKGEDHGHIAGAVLYQSKKGIDFLLGGQ